MGGSFFYSYIFLLNVFISFSTYQSSAAYHDILLHNYGEITELDRENTDCPPYLISHGQKIGWSRVLLETRSEVAIVCAQHCKSEARNVYAT